MTLVPHFDVATTDGGRVRYADIWQRANLLLVCLAGADAHASAAYRRRLDAGRPDLAATDTRIVVTSDPVAGFSAPTVVIADRWGEVQHVVAAPASLAGLPGPDDLAEWLRFVQMRCPECEGEWR